MPVLTRLQAETMLTLQAQMNARVNSAWLEANYPYLRAVVVEGAEAMEHHGWKWWKKQTSDLEQLQMELVDIWHFTLSNILLEARGNKAEALQKLLTPDTATAVHFDGRDYVLADLDLISKLELNIGLAVARRISLPLFAALLRDCRMEWKALFCQYVGKNVLNFFRQDHGYKEGTYRKLWNGREDNEHLVEIMNSLNSEEDGFQHCLYASLKARYEVT